MQTQLQPVQHFSTNRFLEIRAMARKYFFAERINFGLTPTVTELREYLSYFINDNEMPTLPTIARWHSAWKRSN